MIKRFLFFLAIVAIIFSLPAASAAEIGTIDAWYADAASYPRVNYFTYDQNCLMFSKHQNNYNDTPCDVCFAHLSQIYRLTNALEED